MKYNITVREVRYLVFEINASSEDEAEEIFCNSDTSYIEIQGAGDSEICSIDPE